MNAGFVITNQPPFERSVRIVLDTIVLVSWSKLSEPICILLAIFMAFNVLTIRDVSV
jgi:hypothetical protein